MISEQFLADAQRYDGRTQYRRCGRSGLDLPAISLGLWQNFGGVDLFETGRAVLRRAFDLGVTHFDLANNYGPPYGSAEENFGRWLAADFRPYRDELIISTKAGYDMWPGPYGDHGSRKYLLASLDQSLRRMGLDYVDIFYSHRVDPATPLEETMGALAHAWRQGKALYVGISSYSPELTRRAHDILEGEGVPLLIHQPSYSIVNRWVEHGLLDTLGELGVGCIAFSPLGQGLLTNKYLNGVPADARAARNDLFSSDFLTPETIEHMRQLNALAQARGQTLAQMAIAWVLRDRRVTSALIGARSVAQLEDSLAAVRNLDFSDDELRRIDALGTDAGIDIWEGILIHRSGPLKRLAFLAATLFLCGAAPARRPAQPEIAITIDDLPAHFGYPTGVTPQQVSDRMLAALKNARVPVTGFVNAVKVQDQPETVQVLRDWRAAGFVLGNHGWSHRHLSEMTVAEFEHELVKDEPGAKRLGAGTDWRWFRYPFLDEGKDQAQRAAARHVLAKHGYRVAAVSMSFDDWKWTEPYARCASAHDDAAVAELERLYLASARENLQRSRDAARALLGHDIPYVLLMHVSAMSARMMPRVIQLYRDAGYRLVSLPEAERDPAYRAYTDLSLPAPPSPQELAARRGVKLPRGTDFDAKLASMCPARR